MKRTLLSLFLIILFALPSFCEKFSFAVFGDNRDGDTYFMDLIKKMNNDDDIKFAVNTGDLTSRGTAGEYEKYFEMAGESKARIYDVIGNHDLGFLRGGASIFKKRYGETYYYFDHENSRFIIVDDTSSRGLGRKQQAWLKKALDTGKNIFVFLHKPLMDPSGTYPKYVMAPESEKEELIRMMAEKNVKYVIAGHIHGYGRENVGGSVYLISGGAGAPLYLPAFNGGFYHYVKITVDGKKINDEVVKLYE